MLQRLFNEQRPLMWAGVVSFLLFAVTAVLVLVDPTEILGINRWIKPMKFFILIAIFLWTMAVYFEALPERQSTFRRLSWAMIVIFIIEMAVITGQPLRGTTSHFNSANPLDGALFAAMGIAIAILTLIVAYLTLVFFRSDLRLPPAVAWGLRLGLLVMLFGSIQGGYMASQGAHAVGVADGGAGLPLVNWSTEGGDLRVAHFLGLHGLQAIPIFGLVTDRIRHSGSVALTVGFAVVYAAAFTAVFVQALSGRPLLALV